MIGIGKPAGQPFAGCFHNFVGNSGPHLVESRAPLVFGRASGLLDNLIRLAAGILKYAFLQPFSLGPAFIQNRLALGLQIGNAPFDFRKVFLCLLAAFFQFIQRILDSLAAVAEKVLYQLACKVPENCAKDDQVQHAPGKIAPAVFMPFPGKGVCGKNKHQAHRRKQPEKFAQNPPP